MAESIDRIIAEEAFDQLKQLLSGLEACDAKMQEFIKTVDSLKKSLEGSKGLKQVGEEYEKLVTATEKLNKATEEKVRIEEKVEKECRSLAVYVAKEREEYRKGGEAMSEQQRKMQSVAETMVDQQRRLQSVTEQLKAAKAEYAESGRGSAELKTRIAELMVEEAKLKESIADGSKEFKNRITESRNEEGSLRSKAALLSQLKQQYESLSESERNNSAVGGELRQQMSALDAELKEAKTSGGGITRTFGDTTISVGRLKLELREMMEDIQAETFVFQELRNAIADQNGKVAEAARVHGQGSAEYRNEADRLQELQRAHAEAGDKIEEMRRKAGSLKDIIADTNDAIVAWSSDTANVDAVVTGLDTVVQGYTVVQGSMAALGIESQELVDAFAKVKLMQEGVNAVQKIADNLTKESVFKSKMMAAWNKIRTAYIEEQTKALLKKNTAEKANNAETIRNTAAEKANVAVKKTDVVATNTAAASTGGLAVAEKAATATSFSLTAALKAVGAAIKSIPVIGWILAAVAALGTLIGLIVSANREESEGERLQKEKEARQQAINDCYAKAREAVSKETMELERTLKKLHECKDGTDEYEKAVEGTAKMLGVSADWVKKNKDRVDDLAAAWKRVKLAQAQQDAFMQAAADADVKMAQLDLARAEMLAASVDNRRKTVEKWAEVFGWGDDTVDDMVQSVNDTKTSNEKKYRNAMDEIDAVLNRSRRDYAATKDAMVRKADEAAEAMAADEKIVADAQKESTDAAEKAKQAVEKAKQVQSAAASKAAENEKKLVEIRQQVAELEAKNERERHELKMAKLEDDYRRELAAYGKTEEAKALIQRKYGLQRDQLEREYSEKQLERVEAANREMLEILNTLNEKRLRDSAVSGEQLTEVLVGLERNRLRSMLEENERNFRKEVKDLDENGAEYYAIRQKWDAKNEQQTYESTQREAAIRKQGFEQILKDIRQQVKDDENRLAIDAYETGMSEADVRAQQQQLKIDGINAEIEAYQAKKDKLSELGITEQEYNSKMLELGAQLASAQKERHTEEMARLEAQKQARKELALTISDSVFAIGNALADGIEDERRKVVVQQSLAMAQVLLEQAVAIAEATSSATKGDPYTIAIRIAAAVGAVATSFITAKNAISQAKQSTAESYAEGTQYHHGGAAIVGEGGKPELVLAGGRHFVVDQPTFFENLPVGAKVIPLESGNVGSQTNIKLGEVISELTAIRNRSVVKIDVGENVYSHIVKGASQSRILNSQFSH